MARAFILVLDSFGIGASFDAEKYGDAGADTFGHIVEACAEGAADIAGLRAGPLQIPNLHQLGIAHAALSSTGKKLPGFPTNQPTTGQYGYAVEKSLGKDTPSGHWEIAGVPVMFEWGYFPPEYPSFPDELLSQFIEACELPGVLGNKHASGTVIIDELGEEHIASGKPIVYTSADSVFQIAAHEAHFGLEKLYACCEIARKLVDPYNIGRVIARPFTGEKGHYERTPNRRDYATPPPEPTLLERLQKAGRDVISIGKIADIYAHQGITQSIKGKDNNHLFQQTLTMMPELAEGGLLMTNFVDFDSKYGHRRDIAGYAAALEAFDRQLPEFIAAMQSGDIAIITADHGCDPSFPGSDHTREHIPVLMFGPDVQPGFLGRGESFAAIGQTVAKHLQIDPLDYGVAFTASQP